MNRFLLFLLAFLALASVSAAAPTEDVSTVGWQSLSSVPCSCLFLSLSLSLTHTHTHTQCTLSHTPTFL
jgi:hypothetical protein